MPDSNLPSPDDMDPGGQKLRTSTGWARGVVAVVALVVITVTMALAMVAMTALGQTARLREVELAHDRIVRQSSR